MSKKNEQSADRTIEQKVSLALKIAVAAIFAALVAVVTLSFTIPIPATQGIFNFGEVLIYSASLLFGPFVGLIAGSGASIADMLVAPHYAVGTLIIKAIEGFLVGYLIKKLSHKIKNLTICAFIAIIVGGSEMVAGYFLYQTLVLGFPILAALYEVPFNIFQMLIGLIIAVPVVHAVQRVFPQLKSYL